ncbi:MAG: mechanosensitive ion channel family protein [Sedimentisphaerales bacterium]|nr:mechanosensitive ion channel family protein [Sedimentisphaerales bacterium]
MTATIELFKDGQWILPAIFLGGGVLLGIFVDHVVLPIVKKLAERTSWEFDDIIINSLRGLFIVWFGILGARLAAESAHDSLSPRTIDLTADALKVLFIGSFTFLAARIMAAILQRYIQKSGAQIPGASIFTNIVKLIIFMIGLLMILNALDIAITPILTALGVGGLAVALALQDTLSNLFAGIHIVASKQIKPGDYIKLDTGDEGYVTDVGWRNTTIKALPNNMIIVPNSKVASAIIVNYHQPDREMGLPFQVGVSYDSDLEKVEKVTIEVAKEVLAKTNGGVKIFEPFIRYHTFADFSINFSVILRVNEFTDQYLIKHEFVKALHKRYREEGIEIPYPNRTVMSREKD